MKTITHPSGAGKGFAGECLEFARQIAEKENCYKMMLLTGSKSRRLFGFMKNADITAAIRQPLYTICAYTLIIDAWV